MLGYCGKADVQINGRQPCVKALAIIGGVCYNYSNDQKTEVLQMTKQEKKKRIVAWILVAAMGLSIVGGIIAGFVAAL